MTLNNVSAKGRLELVQEMMEKGRRAAAFDGMHLVVWGSVFATLLTVQYAADARDWLPGQILWLWQPAVIALWILSLALGWRQAQKRQNNPMARLYAASFAAAGSVLILFALASAWRDRPDPYTFALLAHAMTGSAFFVMAVATELRKLIFAAAGWWAGFVYFAFKGEIIAHDFIVIIASLVLFMIVPGIDLMLRRRSLPGDTV